MRQLELLAERFAKSAEAFPDICREVLKKAGRELLPAVRRGIGGTGTKVRYWQELHMGSRGGYAAVRPKAKTFVQTKRTGKQYAVGHITNAIESGHKTRGGGGRVPGKHFYQGALPDAVRLQNAAAEEITRRLAETLGGR